MIAVMTSPRDIGFVNVLTFMMPPGKREKMVLRLNGSRRRNLAMREPGWIDADPPEWDWAAPVIDFTSRAIRIAGN